MLLWNKNSHKSMVPVYLLNILLKKDFLKLIMTHSIKWQDNVVVLFLIAKRSQLDWPVGLFHCWGKLACATECLRVELNWPESSTQAGKCVLWTERWPGSSETSTRNWMWASAAAGGHTVKCLWWEILTCSRWLLLSDPSSEVEKKYVIDSAKSKS